MIKYSYQTQLRLHADISKCHLRNVFVGNATAHCYHVHSNKYFNLKESLEQWIVTNGMINVGHAVLVSSSKQGRCGGKDMKMRWRIQEMCIKLLCGRALNSFIC